MIEDRFALALAILRNVKRQYPDAFLAGGFLRDMDFGIVPKDVDIFTWASVVDEHPKFEIDIDEHYSSDSRITFVAARPEFILPTDVVFLADGTENEAQAVALFALGIQQIYWGDVPGILELDEMLGSEQGVIKTTNYNHDKENKCLTVRRCGTELEAGTIAAKVRKLQAGHFAGWPLVVPPEFEEFELILHGGAL